MKKIHTPNALYAGGLLLAAIAGSFVATETSAKAQNAAPFVTPKPKMGVKLTSDVMVERVSIDDRGREIIKLKTPKEAVVVPGDRLIVSLHYVNQSNEPATEFRATNPIPGPVQFIAAKEDWAEVSVDNGATWGVLSALFVAVPATEAASASRRPAVAQDVTHVRWTFQTPLAPGEKGTVSFRGSIK
jgi:hypothetical protein